MKNVLIAGVIGLLFMSGGFYFGMRLSPPPPKPAPVQTVAAPVVPPNAAVAVKDPISIDDLRKTSDSMLGLNQALKQREDQVNEREQKIHQREDELAAERTALDSSHEKFKALFAEFQQRLDLVGANQLEQLQKQAELYSAMGDQAIDLIRPMDDAAVTRLFSVMDTKPLSKLIGLWKTKYPADAPRLMKTLDDMAKVMPKEKIALSDPSISSAAPAPDAATPAPATDATTPAPDASTPAAPAPTPDTAAPTAAMPDATTSSAVVSSPDASAPSAPSSLAPPADPTPSQVPAGKVPDTSLPPAPRPAAASSGENTPASTPAPNANSASDITTPGATAAAPVPDPQDALPNNPTPPVANPLNSTSSPTRAPRALPVTINTAATE